MKKGFTLIEVLIATVVLTGAILAILASLIQCSNLQETSKNLGLTISAARAKVEEMRNVDFSDLITNYNGPFDVSGLDAKGRVDSSYVAGSNNNLIDIRVVICWRQGRNRIIGEDINLNGNLDPGEDVNPTNGRLDSPAQIVTLMAER